MRVGTSTEIPQQGAPHDKKPATAGDGTETAGCAVGVTAHVPNIGNTCLTTPPCDVPDRGIQSRAIGLGDASAVLLRLRWGLKNRSNRFF